MELNELFRSVIEQDRSAVVICDLKHTIVYMNPTAMKRYQKYGGAVLLGKNLLDCHGAASAARIEEVTKWFGMSPENNLVYTSFNEKENKDVYMVALRDENKKLIGYYEKHEYRSRETMKMYEMGE